MLFCLVLAEEGRAGQKTRHRHPSVLEDPELRGFQSIFRAMKINPTPLDASGSKTSVDAVSQLADDELECLAVHWRLQARHGDREAFGRAHMLEVEKRNRQPVRAVINRPLARPIAVSVSHSRWKFWIRHDERFFVSQG